MTLFHGMLIKTEHHSQVDSEFKRVKSFSRNLNKMVRVFVSLAMICFFGLASAQYVSYPYIYPVEHRSDVKALQDEANLKGYDFQIVPNVREERQAVTEYDPALDPANVSLLSLVWEYLPSPIIAIKAALKLIISKIWTIVKFLIPVNLVVLGMGLVLGFCAFTPYCTLIIEEPIASKIRAIRSNIPYIDELEYYVHEAIGRVHELQFL